jgi:hypothetical protein
MFPVEGGSRKRSRRAALADDSSDADAVGPLLRDVVACLTGFPAEEKERIHRLIQELGGRYVNSIAMQRKRVRLEDALRYLKLTRRTFMGFFCFPLTVTLAT